jgi:formate-nitrite transporter family protein
MTQKEQASRLTADEILEAAIETAADDLERSTTALAFSGFAGGFGMGLTALGVALIRHHLGEESPAKLVSYLLYPAGFIAVIIGRSQLFTENTVYPVVLVLRRRSHVVQTLRLWAAVLGFNVLGALAFAALAVKTPAISSGVQEALISLGTHAAHRTTSAIFFSAILGGWMIALVAWTVTASQWTIGHVVMIWLITFVVGAGEFAHSIAGTVELLAAVLGGALGAFELVRWFSLAVLGNVVGGVVFVSLLNYGQVHGGDA